MSKEAMKLALEALEMVDRDDNDRDFLFPSQCYQLDEAITALREALNASLAEQPAQPQQEPAQREGIAESPNDWPDWKVIPPQTQQEPVEVKQIAEPLRQVGLTLVRTSGSFRVMDLGRIEAQTTFPPTLSLAQRKPLTPDQIEPIAIDVLGYGAFREQDLELFTQCVRAIEAAHGIKEKNNG